jgi:adenine-specific DNA-methyltransferase
MTKTGKLELTWVGKYDAKKIEPRILIEDKEKSNPILDKNTENLLIHGDNLIALKALEEDFSGKIKCIYIDPPFNTGARINADGKEIGYEDGIEHSIWLNMMKDRLSILHSLLSDEGSIYVHLDDNEVDYCKLILDEVFRRENFINRLVIDARSPSAFSTVNPGVFKSSEYILWFAKDKSKWISKSMRIPCARDNAYNKFIVNRVLDTTKWEFKPLKIAFLESYNSDRIYTISAFIRNLYDNAKGLTKKEIKAFITDNFSLYQVLNIEKTAEYLRGKLKIKDFDEYFRLVYSYLLEKCSYLYNNSDFDSFVFENSDAVFRDTEIDDDGAGREIVELKYLSIDNPDVVLTLERSNGLDTVYVKNGKQLSFYSKNVERIEGKLTATKLLTNIWSDISWEGIAKEGGVVFRKGKKPERLINRLLHLASEPNDWVLDSFLGSGTTAAVAHKMGRRWVGIELGDHAYTHCKLRMDKVIDGEQGGVSRSVGWTGGGGYRFYELAPSLFEKHNVLPIYEINKDYTFEMLCEAICKLEGFRYEPQGEMHGKSSETRFIHIASDMITGDYIRHITKELSDHDSILIYGTKIQSNLKLTENIEIKRIPNDILKKFDFESEVK